MKPATLALASLAAAVAGFAALAHRQAAQAADEAQAAPDAAGPADRSAWNSVDLWGMTQSAIESRTVDNALNDTDTAGANVAAGLSLIDYSEGSSKGGRDPYRTCYGYVHTIERFADHPAVTGEWKGEPLDSLGPAYAGLVSTAAGRYQIKRSTWLECKRALGLPDFSPASQDRAAVFLIKRRGALDDLRAGRVADVITKCAKEWASLPGAGYGQGERKLASLIDAYTNAGGNLA